MLVAGANGGTNATSGIVPELTRSIHRSVVAGEIEQAMKLQYQLLPLFDTMISIGEFPEGFRAGARSRGWDLGPGRVPLSDQQKSSVAESQRQIDDLLKEFSDRPTVGVSSQAIEKIVQQVMTQLRA
jgi:4-hydroxy-tetrahydrodipicolinate synthase